MVGNGPGYEIEGTGFRPGSDVILTGESPQPMVFRADDRGEFPDAGLVGILGGDGPQRFVFSGTASDDTPALVELAVPAREG